MQFIKTHKWLVLLLGIILLVAAVVFFITKFSNRSIQTLTQDTSLPDISYFKDHPTDLFLLTDADYQKYIASTSPFLGTKSSCPHTGGHINFTPQGAPYEVNIITPVDGVVSRVNTCFDLGVNDKFDIGIDFAQYQGNPVSLDYSIEPFAGLKCKNNPDFYKQYIKVEPGQTVKAGDVIGIMPKFTSDPNSGTHIHFNLSTNGKMVCPNIFTHRLETALASKYMQGACNMQPISEATFCYLPGPGEDLFQ